MQEVTVAILSSVTTISLGGLVAWINRLKNRSERHKTHAEADRLEAEASKLSAEADDISSSRLLRELDHLAATNAEQRVLINRQADDIELMRERITAYAVKEQEHAIENAVLRARIRELERPIDDHMLAPLISPHVENEFDEDRDESADD